MRHVFAATLFATAAAAEEVPTETITAIGAALAAMQCEVAPENIEAAEGGGYELDDVFCADGQYDMDLDAALNVVGKRKE